MGMIFFKIFILIFSSMFYEICSAEKLFQIELSKVEVRQLFGGLGSAGSIGEVTELFVPQLDTPIASIPGDKSSAFKKMLYIYKSESYYSCPNDKLDKTCVNCIECVQSQGLETFKKYDVKNAHNVRKNVLRNMGFANINQNGKKNIEFIFPIKGQKPLELMVKSEKLGTNVDVLLPFRNNNYRTTIFKSTDDPNYYLCPDSGFSQSCLICENCVEKLANIKSFKMAE